MFFKSSKKTFTRQRSIEISVFLIIFINIVLLIIPTNAQNWYKYAVINITNLVDETIYYSYRWGNGTWRSDSVNPGICAYYCYEYSYGSQSSPNFQIRFDSDMSTLTYWKIYNLDRYAARYCDCEDGKKYYFAIDIYGNLDLYAK